MLTLPTSPRFNPCCLLRRSAEREAFLAGFFSALSATPRFKFFKSNLAGPRKVQVPTTNHTNDTKKREDSGDVDFSHIRCRSLNQPVQFEATKTASPPLAFRVIRVIPG